MTAMERVCSFIKDAQTYYLATVDGDQPRVRPFGTIHIFEDKLYIQTGRAKDVAKQLAANPKAEICAFKDGVWLTTTALSPRSLCWTHIRAFALCMIPQTAIQRFCISRTRKQLSAPLRQLLRQWSSDSGPKRAHRKEEIRTS